MKVPTLQVNNVLVVFTSTAKYCTFNYVRGDWGNNHWVGIQTQWAHSYLDFMCPMDWHFIIWCPLAPIPKGGSTDVLDL